MAGLIAKLIAAKIHTAHSIVDNILEGAQDIVKDGMAVEYGALTPIGGLLSMFGRVIETVDDISDDSFNLVAYEFDAISTVVTDFTTKIENHFEAKFNALANFGHKLGHVADNVLEVVGIDIGYDCCQ